MSMDAERRAALQRDYDKRRKEAGYRHVRAVLPPELLETIDQIANGRSRAAVLADLVAEKAAQLNHHEQEGCLM